jgi:hypothetical protein
VPQVKPSIMRPSRAIRLAVTVSRLKVFALSAVLSQSNTSTDVKQTGRLR